MKNWSLALLVVLLIHEQVIHVQVLAAGDGFIRTRGVQFMLNGSPYYANGFNAYWLMYMASSPSQRQKVTTAFQEALSHGLTVARTWAFSDGGNSPLQYSPGSYNEQMFQGLDFVISEAGKYGIKLILSLVDNYEYLGGKKQYVNWARSQGQYLSSDDDFFTNSVVKGYYKNHIKTVLTRRNTITGVSYKDDPTIMAWELMNEPRCPSDTSGRTLQVIPLSYKSLGGGYNFTVISQLNDYFDAQVWITEMASYLKSIDRNHLLEVGLEGFYGPSKQQYNPNSLQIGTDFISNNQFQGIDFVTVHSYPDEWLTGENEESQHAFLNNWLNTHIQDAQHILNKPLLFAEFGKSGKDPGYSTSQRDRLFSTVYSAIYSSASGGGAAGGGLFWQLLTEGMDSYRDGYEIIFSESSSTASIIDQESRKLVKIRKMYARLRDIEIWKKARVNKGGFSVTLGN